MNFKLEDEQSNNNKHPEFIEEEKRLSAFLSTIRQKIDNDNPSSIEPNKYWELYGGADEYTARIFHYKAQNAWVALNHILNEPYFGRIDFSSDGNENETFYIGKQGFSIDGMRVIDWRAPFCQLYYKNISDDDNHVSYLAGSGLIFGYILLKRHLQIEDQELIQILDDIDWRHGQPVIQGGKMFEEILIRELYSRGDPRLQDIVKTIQEQQDRIIRSPFKTSLILNGVAGSGKTSIAYHRVAYLLYPETHSNLKSGNIIIFNPNRLFLNYVKDLLPSLGVKDVNQVTFDDWALKQMGLAIEENGKTNRKIELQDSSMDIFLNKYSSREEKVNCWKKAKLKGRLSFKTIIERYVDLRRNSFIVPINGWIIEHLGKFDLSIRLSADEIRKAYNDSIHSNLDFENQRNRFLSQLYKLIDDKYEPTVQNKYQQRIEEVKNSASIVETEILEERIKDAQEFRNQAFANPIRIREVVDVAKDRLKIMVDDAWKPIKKEDYFDLFKNPTLLKKLSKGVFNVDEVNILLTSKVKEGTIDIEDLPALMYLHFLCRGKGPQIYDHIVVDEAQDFSPLQFHILKQYSSNGSMTITGDIAQGIYAHRGITDWSEVVKVLTDLSITYEEILQNYRATKEIVEFTNEVDRAVRKDRSTYAKPFNRRGSLPNVYIAKKQKDVYLRIEDDIAEIMKTGIKNIGIIAKTFQECESFWKFIKTRTKQNITMISGRDIDYEFKGGIVITPINLAKGLEFEAAFVINVDENNFDEKVEYDGRLLYVAITRALHILNIYIAGNPSGFLNRAILKANVIR